MNRRQFLTRLSTAAVATCVAAKIPTTWLPAPVQRRAAIEFLTHAWNDVTKGRGLRAFPGGVQMYASAALFDAFESECLACERFCDAVQAPPERVLAFKGARLYRREDPYSIRWQVAIPLPDGTYYHKAVSF